MNHDDHRQRQELVTRWHSGDHIVLREVMNGGIWAAQPVTVVQDAPDLLALHMAAGTLWRVARNPGGSRPDVTVALPGSRWQLVESRWVGGDALYLTRPGAAHAVWAMWNEGDASLAYWYINLQEPLRRTALGFDFLDHILDIVVSSDLSSWCWKDEERLQRAVAVGAIPAANARAIRAEGERALELVKARRPPFNCGWEKWAPPVEWPIPRLPDGWDVL
jgi:hypothetical protein